MPTSIAQRNIEASKSQRPMPTSVARRNIHIAKSPRLRLPRIARDNGIGLGVTTRCARNRFRSDSNGNDDDDDDWKSGHCFQGGRATTSTMTWT